MGYSAKWKTLEDLMVELRKKGFETPSNVIGDFRNAKNMINLTKESECTGDATAKLEEILSGVESALIGEAEAVLTEEEINDWLKRLQETSQPTRESKTESPSSFVTGVPRDQKWIRVEPIPNLSTEHLTQIAKENNLSINQQKDGRLVVYGQQEAIKAFLKKMTDEATKK